MREAYDDHYYLELFRRATVCHEEAAWEVLQHRFSAMVLSWISHHPNREVACCFDSEVNYVAQAFERFWYATSHTQQLEFRTLAAALEYLRQSLNSVVLDALRVYSRPKEVALPEPGFLEVPAMEDDDDGQAFWEILEHMLPNPREQRLAYLLFHCGLKPREILHHCPQEFSNVREIYCLRRNILARLLRNADHIRWQLDSR